MALTQVTEKGIKDGEIVNADVNASAAIAGSKLAASTTSVAGSMSAADKTKLDGVAASANNYTHPTSNGNKHIPADGSAGQFLKYDSAGTAVWAADNNTVYTHPNHTGEVTSTADGATVIASNIVDEDNLKVSNAPTNGYVLTAQSGDTGGLTWAAAASGSSADDCIWKNSLTISNPHTIAATEGAHSVGPITLNATVTLNGRWVIS